MKIGINIRVMGPQSTAETISSLLSAAEDAGVESAWIVDHIAIPPDDSEGSGGRYLDPLATLAWMAGQTNKIKIGKIWNFVILTALELWKLRDNSRRLLIRQSLQNIAKNQLT